ncbi:hypothetical protein EOD41_03145 [Mucilaginibacter limnophilus]|uniref:CBM20 domain-containing protein n=1 Tax=Mucilaginibacter limnophilus TaxID=1932778 RepID=A0A437MZ67_9SPHI|nr:hypothetical protein [Mucilaginibacter limnophilus]RVU02947.1 hypothetical protein EOD41_03145 [Mucilaginibacter limnophilus]
MRLIRYYILTLLLLACGMPSFAQKASNNLVLTDDKLILLLDLRSSQNSIDSILKRAGIPPGKGDDVLNNDFKALLKDGWQLRERHGNVVQFNKSIESDVAPSKPYLLTVNLIKTSGRPGYPAEVVFGRNKFSRLTVRELPSGLTRFFMPGNLAAKKVQLSGSFNKWTTSQGLMLKTDSGWIKDIKLSPGIYAYKYIINGRWTHDIFNQQSEDDGYHGYNSIYFRYNYTFKLPGYLNAKSVAVTGNFNNWEADDIPLRKTKTGWQVTLYLHEGSYKYHFVVDGKSLADPANSSKVKEDNGTSNSVINLGETVAFKLKGYQNAKKVCVAGNFNNWKPDNLYLKKLNNEWLMSLVLKPGNYQYKFIVDGNWMTDPANTCYAVEGGITNSFMAVDPTYTFRLKGYAKASSVRVAGSFNNWDPDQYTMCRNKDEWYISMKLSPGKHRYKFIVDGKWILDPANKLWEENEHNTGNSVLWLE